MRSISPVHVPDAQPSAGTSTHDRRVVAAGTASQPNRPLAEIANDLVAAGLARIRAGSERAHVVQLETVRVRPADRECR